MIGRNWHHHCTVPVVRLCYPRKMREADCIVPFRGDSKEARFGKPCHQSPPDVTADEHLSLLFDKIGFQLTVGDEVYSSSTETPERLKDRQTDDQSGRIHYGEYC